MATAWAVLLLAACGGGSGGEGAAASDPPGSTDNGGSTGGSSGGSTGSGSSGGGSGVGTTPSVERPANKAQAARFLTQATYGPTDAEVDRVMSIGYAAWIDEQFAKPASSHQASYRAIDQAYVGAGLGTTIWQTGTVNAFWKHALSGEDQLRQRTAFALSQIMVISMQDSSVGDNGLAVSAYLDMLGDKGLGNYRDLLEGVASHPLMGTYLSHLKNRKADAVTGRVPDENFAREVMQLFSIGLHELNADGTPKMNGATPLETYTGADIAGLAKVFTGYSWRCSDWTDNSCFYSGKPSGAPSADKPDWVSPMMSYLQFYSEDSKAFLGKTIASASPANPASDLKLALDTLANHPNVGPFIGKQLIQRLVASNPSPKYVSDISAVFANNGSGVRGDMKAVIKAILMHPEARTVSDTSGKLREPILRMTAFMRAFGHQSLSGYYWMNSTDNPGTQLGQTPLRSPSVFNFYRPGYVSPGSVSASRSLVAPELQIVHETSAAGYVNFVRDTIDWGGGWDLINSRNDLFPDYSAYVALAEQPSALIDKVADKLLYEAMPADLKSEIQTALDSIVIPAPDASGSNQSWIDTLKLRRVKVAIFLTMLSPEFQVQK